MNLPTCVSANKPPGLFPLQCSKITSYFVRKLITLPGLYRDRSKRKDASTASLDGLLQESSYQSSLWCWREEESRWIIRKGVSYCVRAGTSQRVTKTSSDTHSIFHLSSLTPRSFIIIMISFHHFPVLQDSCSRKATNTVFSHRLSASR